MQKTELIAEIADRSGVSKKQAKQVLDTALHIIAQQLQQGERVVLTGFGTFEVRDRRARQGVNPQTKAPMAIGATRTPGFSASNSFKELVRQHEPNGPRPHMRRLLELTGDQD